jgi:hypothetical protein
MIRKSNRIAPAIDATVSMTDAHPSRLALTHGEVRRGQLNLAP